MKRLARGVALLAWLPVAGPAGAQGIDAAAERLLSALSEEEREEARYAFGDDEREDVRYAPILLEGLRQGDLPPERAALVDELLAVTLSRRGLAKVRAIRELELAVRRKEEGRLSAAFTGWMRDPGRYFLALFGEPGGDAAWGYRYDGHHVSLNLTAAPGRVPSSTPLFLGAEPRAVPEGWPAAGIRALGEEEDLARALYAALDEEQRARAALPFERGRGLVLGEVRRVAPPDGPPAGLARADMTPAQGEMLDGLLELFVSNWNDEIAAARRAEIERAGRGAVHFAYAEADEPTNAFYVRLQGPALLVEIDNTTDGDHVHAIWHGVGSDFGDDLLAEHRRRHHGPAARRGPQAEASLASARASAGRAWSRAR